MKTIEKITLKPQLFQKVFEKDDPELGDTGIDFSKLAIFSGNKYLTCNMEQMLLKKERKCYIKIIN